MRRNVSIFPIPSEPYGDDFSFPAMILADEIRNAIDNGVSESVSSTIVFDDDGVTEIDPLADIRMDKLDARELDMEMKVKNLKTALGDAKKKQDALEQLNTVKTEGEA